LNLLVLASSSMLVYSFVKQWMSQEDQHLIGNIGIACSIALFTCSTLNIISVIGFSFTKSWSSVVGFSDFVTKLSMFLVIAIATFTLRLWDDLPFLTEEPTLKDYIIHPVRSWILSLCALSLLLLICNSLLGAWIPYLPVNIILNANIQTWAFFLTGACLFASIISINVIIGEPSYFFADAVIWSTLALSMILGLAAFSLAATSSAAHFSKDINSLWLFTLILFAGGITTVSVFNYKSAVPDFSLPVTSSDYVFTLASLGFVQSFLILQTFLHLSLWKLYTPSALPTSKKSID